jgi:hypothetical protein
MSFNAKPKGSDISYAEREARRSSVKLALETSPTIELLDIEPMRPSEMSDFAFIATTPKQAKKRYRCSFCKTDRKFLSGRIVLSSDRKLRLIGPECWEKYFDQRKYNSEIEDYRNYEKIERFKVLRDRLLPALDDMSSGIDICLKTKADNLTFASNLSLQVKNGMPKLYSCLYKAQRTGSLSVERTFPNRKSEYPKYTLISDVIHRPLGLAAIFNNPQNTISELKDALRRINVVRRTIRDLIPDTKTTKIEAKIINEIEVQIKSAATKLIEVRKMLDDVSQFASHQNILGIEKWLLDQDCEVHATTPWTLKWTIEKIVYFDSSQNKTYSLYAGNVMNSNIIPNPEKIIGLLERS